MDPTTAEVGGVKPSRLLAVGEVVEVQGSGKRPYRIKRTVKGHYTCTCSSFQNAQGASSVAARSCPHLAKILGKEYEAARQRAAGSTDAAAPTYAESKRQKKEAAPFNWEEYVAARERVREEQQAGTSSSSGSSSNRSMLGPKGTSLGDGYETDWRGNCTFNGRAIRKDFDPTSAIAIMQAEKWDTKLDPTGWWMSEKLDGVRAYWTGNRLVSRTNLDWKAPQWFIEKLPKGFALDGELWRERDGFEVLSGMCQRADTRAWSTINFFVFDAPDVEAPFEKRMEEARKRVPDGELTPDEALRGRFGGKVATLPFVACEGQAHLDRYVDAIMLQAGEGAMLRRRNSPYERRRSMHCRKVKRWDDGEGVMEGTNRGVGARSHRHESLRVRMASGKVVDIGMGMTESMHLGNDLPEKGVLVKYRCSGLFQDGTPRIPVYEGVCYDRTQPRDPEVAATQIRKKRKQDDEEFLKAVAADLEATQLVPPWEV